MPIIQTIRNTLALRERIQSFVGPALDNTIGRFVETPEVNIPGVLKPYHSAYRRVCDIYARSGIAGDLVNALAQNFYDNACGRYLGADLPTYSGGGVCLDKTLTYNFVAVANPGQPVAGPITANVRAPYSIQGPADIGVPGTVACIYADTPLGNVSLTCTSQPQFVNDLAVLDLVESDNCDPPVPPPSYDPTLPGPAPPSNYEYDNPDGPNVVINVGDPTVNIRGEFSLPITIGDVNFDFGAGEVNGPAENGNDSPVVGSTSDSNVDAVAEAPPGTTIVGVEVQIVDPVTGGTVVNLQGGEQLRIPRHGVITFEDDRGFETDPVNVRLNGQYIACPIVGGGALVRSSPYPGVRWLVTLLLKPEEN